MNNLTLRITNIDMHGYLGRDFHPTPADIGVEGRVLEAFAEITDQEGYVERFDPKNSNHRMLATNAEAVTLCYTIITSDRRLLEVIEHEVEVVR